MENSGVRTQKLICELGLTDLGEWMNLRVYFPSDYDFKDKDGEALGLRMECFNSVDGSSSLVILLGWLRFVCSNGLVIGKTKVALRDRHNQRMDLKRIPAIIQDGMEEVEDDRDRLAKWDTTDVDLSAITVWVNGALTKAWGKKAACRTYHICCAGRDATIADPFASGEATEKPVFLAEERVPSAPTPATTLYDVSQALSYIASRRNNPEEALHWRAEIPALLSSLSKSQGT